MSNPLITLEGRLTDDVELRYTKNGEPVGNVSIATSDSRKTQGGDWEDVRPSFWRCTIWGQLAEHAAQSLHKGDQVLAVGKLSEQQWETEHGEKRRSTLVTVSNIGPALKFATAQVTRSSGGRSQPSNGWPEQVRQAGQQAHAGQAKAHAQQAWAEQQVGECDSDAPF